MVYIFIIIANTTKLSRKIYVFKRVLEKIKKMQN